MLVVMALLAPYIRSRFRRISSLKWTLAGHGIEEMDRSLIYHTYEGLVLGRVVMGFCCLESWFCDAFWLECVKCRPRWVYRNSGKMCRRLRHVETLPLNLLS